MKKDQNEKKWFYEKFLWLLPIGSAAGGGNTSIMADFVSSLNHIRFIVIWRIFFFVKF